MGIAQQKHKQKQMTKTIVVFGSTGAQGGSVVDFLLKDGSWKVRGVTRDTESDKAKALAKRGVEMVKADVSDKASFQKGKGVFDGAWGAFVVTNFWDKSSMGKELEQGKALVDAAADCKVECLQYASLVNVEKESGNKYKVPHFTDKAKVEEYIRTKNFKYTAFIAAAFYYQNMQTFFAPKEEDGVLVFTLPATSNITAFDVNDIGGVSAAAFKKPESVNHMFVPCSADHFSPAEFVELVGKVTGKKTKLNSLTFEQYAGLGFPGAEELAEMFRWFNAQTYYGLKAKRELGLRLYPQLKTMKQWLEETKAFQK